ncbi:MAG: chorismate--pyruvate lyase [Lachnospiraceae bacterium]
MELVSCKYVVEQINGDYAMLRRLENPDSELKQVARALLPEEIMEGTMLLYEFLQYSVIAGKEVE